MDWLFSMHLPVKKRVQRPLFTRLSKPEVSHQKDDARLCKPEVATRIQNKGLPVDDMAVGRNCAATESDWRSSNQWFERQNNSFHSKVFLGIFSGHRSQFMKKFMHLHWNIWHLGKIIWSVNHTMIQVSQRVVTQKLLPPLQRVIICIWNTLNQESIKRFSWWRSENWSHFKPKTWLFDFTWVRHGIEWRQNSNSPQVKHSFLKKVKGGLVGRS